MRKFIIGLTLILSAAGTTWWFLNRNAKPATAPTASEQNAGHTTAEGPGEPDNERVVLYQSSGFGATEIRLKAGDMLTFTNQSGSLMWVASEEHPEHDDYPEFDAKRGYPKDESYTFTFRKVGTWRYHNHLNPSHTGTVIVE